MNELDFGICWKDNFHVSHIRSWVTIHQSAVWDRKLRWREQWSKACGLMIVTVSHPLVIGIHWLLSQSNLSSKLDFRRNSIMLNIQQNICLKPKPRSPEI